MLLITPNKYVRTILICLFVIFGTCLKAFSQCPTITNPNPIICDASGLTIIDLDAYATDMGGGITWWDAPTGGIEYVNSQLLLEGTYYADDDSGSCTIRPSVVVDFVVDNTGQNLDGIFCDNENATVQTYIDEVLMPIVSPGGDVLVYSDPLLTILVNPSTILVGVNNYYIVFVDVGGCEGQLEIGSTAVFVSPLVPTPPPVQVFCSSDTPTVGDLNPGTSDDVSWYLNIDSNGDPIPPALDPSTPLINETTYYVQADDLFCPSDIAAVFVKIDLPVDAGISGELHYCEDAIPTNDFNLFDELGGTPSTTGTWTGPLPTSNGHLGTVNISSLTPGTHVFVYMVPATGVCPDGSSTVTIIIHEILSPGTETIPVTFCEMDLPSIFDLFSLLINEDPGGVWTDGNGNVVSNPIDLTGFPPGTYEYTYTQNGGLNPCPDASTVVQIIILPDPNPGIAINAQFCENELDINSPFNLFDALDGSQDNNDGVWTDSNGLVVTNPIDISDFTVAGSPYIFTYTISNGTCEDSVIVIITVLPTPDSGIALAPIEFCEDEVAANSPFDLFDLLDGSQDLNGTWHEGLDATGPMVTNPIDLTILGIGVFYYTYSVPDIGTCSDVDVTVQITINPLPNTGIATPFVVCVDDLSENSPLDLFGQLSGYEPGGTWTDDDATGALTGSNVDLTLLTVGSYNFSYSITSSEDCSNSSTVVITVEDAANAGTATNPNYCLIDVADNPTLDLFTQLTGNDLGGIWTDDDATGALTGSIVDITLLGVGSFSFTYTVSGIGTCEDDSVTVIITINDTSAPTAPAIQDFCDSATVDDLTATGSGILWYADLTSTMPLPGNTPLIDGENYFASQTSTVTGCESSERIEVIVNIYDSPNSGSATSPLAVCINNTTVDLNDGLDGSQDPTGVWEDTDGTNALTENIFDASQVTPGTYNFTYLVVGTPPCLDASTVVTVIVEIPVSAGTDASLDICSDNGTVDLFLLLGNADIGGTWSPTLASGTSIFDPLLDNAGTYTYSITNACSSESSTVVITVTAAANAGSDGSISICVVDGSIDLFTILGDSAETNGTWSPALSSNTGVFDPAIDSSGIYTYTVNATAPCTENASSEVTVTVNDSPEPIVIIAEISFCLADEPTVVDLNAAVTGNNITWYDEIDSITPLDLNTVLINGEDYFATQTSSNNCESSQRVEVTVTIKDSPTPTLDTDGAVFCINDDPTLETLSANILESSNEDFVIIWYASNDVQEQLSGNTILVNATTYYAVLLNITSGCESSVPLPVTVDLSGCIGITIPDGFSPNGDLINDTFDIDNLNFLYPNFNMEIYNRYGNLVHTGNANSPRFDGTSNQSRLVSNGNLPVGVYFYILSLNDGTTDPIQGRLYLSR